MALTELFDPRSVPDSSRLGELEREYVLDTMASSLRIVNRHQFFVWTQGSLQRLIPHEILICGLDDETKHGFMNFHFSSTRYFRESHFAAVSDPNTGLLPYFRRGFDAYGNVVTMSHGPCAMGGESDEIGPSMRRLVEENELKNLAACFWISPRNKLQAYYSFSRINAPLDGKLAFLLELIVPYVHFTFLRVLSKEQVAATPSSRSHAGRTVTRRQEEILVLIRDGKTNLEIASILAVSPWTVKNHIQMIFQRLNTTNRTQAITRAISMGILQSN